MQAKNGSIIITIIVVALLSVFAIMYSMPDTPEPQVIDVPTAAEIAAAINISPTAPSNGQLQEIWDEIYSTEVARLERDAIRECENEFDWDDVEDLFPDDTDVRFEDFDDDNQDIVINDLGLDDEDDRSVSISGYFTVTYLPEEGPQTRIADKVYGNCDVTSDDGDLEADLSLAL